MAMALSVDKRAYCSGGFRIWFEASLLGRLLLALSREDSKITQGGCSERTRWSSSLDCSTTYTSSAMAMLLLVHDHMSF